MPEAWLREMGVENKKQDEVHKKSNNEETGRAYLAKMRQQHQMENYEDSLDDNMSSRITFLKMLVVPFIAAVLTSLVYYRISTNSNSPLKPPEKLITSSIVIDSSLADVYNYVSTPDFRTEWHFNAMEVQGPAIDHSSIPGEPLHCSILYVLLSSIID